MNILYITPANPLDEGYGAGVRSAALWKALKRIGHVKTLVVPSFDKNEIKQRGGEDDADVSILSISSTYSGNIKWNMFVLLACLLRCFDWGFPNRERLRRMLNIGDYDYDVIVVRYLWCAGKLGVWKLGPYYVDVDDSPKARFETCVAQFYSTMRRFVARFTYLNWQKMISRKSEGLWYSNQHDTAEISNLNPNVVYLPNVSHQFDLTRYEICEPSDYLLIVGWMRYEPNYRGVDRFLKMEWPLIRNKFPKMCLKIVGRELPEEFKESWLGMPGVELLGYVDDLSVLYARCCAVVTPLWLGGGTSIKVIEAVKYGAKVFATPVAVRGLMVNQLEDMHISVIATDGGFLEALELWQDMSMEERMKVRRDIFERAEKLNSPAEFQEAVERLLVNK